MRNKIILLIISTVISLSASAESYDAIIANNAAFKGNKAEVEARMARLNA